jgi:predicted PurR-regulated permease PerM
LAFQDRGSVPNMPRHPVSPAATPRQPLSSALFVGACAAFASVAAVLFTLPRARAGASAPALANGNPDAADPPSARPAREAARYARFALILVAVLALAAVVWRISGLIVLVFGGIVLAVALRSAAKPLERWLGLAPGWAFTLAVLLIACVLALFGWLIGSQIASEAAQLRQQLPQAWSEARSWLQQSQVGRTVLVGLREAVSSASAARAAGLLATTFGGLADLLLLLVLAIFIGANPALYRRGFLCLVPPRQHDSVAEAIDAAGSGLRKWLMGQGCAMLLVGTITGLGLWLIGIPMALSLGLLAALLNFVPFLGPIAAAIPALLIAFVQGPNAALYTLALYFVIQQLEGNAFQPLIQKWAVSLPPALTLLAVAMFGMLFGIAGVIFATPIMVTLMILVRQLYVKDALGRT